MLKLMNKKLNTVFAIFLCVYLMMHQGRIRDFWKGSVKRCVGSLFIYLFADFISFFLNIP